MKRLIFHFHRTLLLLSFFAFCLRLFTAWELAEAGNGHNSVFVPPVSTDLATYMDLGKKIADGAFSGEFYYQPFYYSCFVAPIYFFTGNSIQAVVFFQALISALTVTFAGLAAAHIAGKKAGLLAAFLTTFSAPLLLYVPFHQIATLQTFFVTLLLYLSLKTFSPHKTLSFLQAFCLAALTGAVLGMSILTRGNMYLLLPALALAAFWGCRNYSFRYRVLLFGTLLIFLIAVQLPFIIHNSLLRGTLTGPSTAANAVLTLGNTPEAPAGGRDPGLPAGPMEYPELYHDWMNHPEAGSVPQRIWQWFLDEPAAVIEFQIRKFLLFFDYREIPNNVSFAVEGHQSTIIPLLEWSSGIILALAVGWIFFNTIRVFRKHSSSGILLWGTLLSYAGSIALFYNLSRFRAPILPTAAVAGSIFFFQFLHRYRKHAPRARPLSALILGLFLTFCWAELFRSVLEAPLMRLIRPNGITTLLSDGRTLQLDHGPRTFGGWQPLQLEPGMQFQKTFAPLNGNFPGGELELTTVSDGPTQIVFELNGRTHSVQLAGKGLETVKLPVPPSPSQPVLKLKVVKVTGDAAMFVDFQRDYGRFLFNDMPAGAEPVWRIRINKSPAALPSGNGIQSKQYYHKKDSSKMKMQTIPLYNYTVEGDFQPYLTTYFHDDPTGRPIVAILPGGGYVCRADHEGQTIAERFRELGFNAAVIEYRVAPNRFPLPQKDARQGIRILRKLARGVGAADKIAILGFSAGGHLAGSAALKNIAVAMDQDAELDQFSEFPDAMILCYPVITSGEFAHAGSFESLLGDQAGNQKMRNLLSLEKQVTDTTVPAFLWHTAADNCVPVENSLLMAKALSAHKIPFALHIYSFGIHGIGLANDYPQAKEWTQEAGRWLTELL